MIMQHLEFNKGKVDTIAAVCDSYDYLKTVDAITSGEFKSKIESLDYPKFIIRPDSGNPIDIVEETLNIMEKNKISYIINSKGFKEFTKYGIIWGDGIDMDIMENLLIHLQLRGYAASNIAFGSGGWLMQQHDRDTQGWAIKCSQVTLLKPSDDMNHGDDNTDGSFGYIKRNVFKDPITDSNKASKKGELTLLYNYDTKQYITAGILDYTNGPVLPDMLSTVYRNGKTLNQQTLEEIRTRSEQQ